MNNKYPYLDGLRTLAIIMVFNEHIHYYLIRAHWKLLEDERISQIFFYFLKQWQVDLSGFLTWLNGLVVRTTTGQGTLGVDLFFVLSGFLITRLLVGNFTQELNVGRFYLRRFFKIYPSYFCLIIFSFIYLMVIGSGKGEALLQKLPIYLFFLQNNLLKTWEMVDNLRHTWSLVVEEQFYFFYPLVALAVYKIFSSFKMRRRVLITIALMVLFISPWIRYVNQLQNNELFATLYHFDALALGCLFAFMESRLLAVTQKKLIGIICWLAGIALYAYLIFYYDWEKGWLIWYSYNLSELAAGCIFLAGLFGVNTLSGLKIFQWIGRHSYGIYLWHYLILVMFVHMAQALPWPVAVVLFALTAILAGVISTWTVERFFLKLREEKIP